MEERKIPAAQGTQGTGTDASLGVKLQQVAQSLSKLDSSMEFTLDDESYVSTETRIVGIIAEDPDVHATGIAKRLGVTKGAVSQELKKLEQKGIIVKERDPENQARLVLSLTEKGRRLNDVHLAFHRRIDQIVAETLAGATEENRKFLQDFLDRVEHEILKIHINE